MYHTIMLPLDGSPRAETAAPLAARIAKRDNARLHLVTVHHLAPNPEAAGWAEADNAMRSTEREYLERFGRDMLDCYGVEVSTALLEGLPARHVLRDFAKEAGVDLVVMATHGRTGLRRAWAGSVADGVVQDAHVPVLLVRPWKRAGVRWDRPFHKVLIPLDGSPQAEQAVAPALALAVPDEPTSVILVQVVEPVTIPLHPYSYAAEAVQVDAEATARSTAEANAYLNGLVAQAHAKHPAIDVSALVLVEKHAEKAVLDTAERAEIDLIAMTTSGRGLRRTIVGGFADKILCGASCPVLLYRPREG